MNLSDLRFVCRELGVFCNGNKSNIINRLLKPLNRNYKMKSDTEQSIYYETMNLYLQSINRFHQFRIDNRVITLLGERHNFEYGCKENGPKISVDKYILNYLKRHPNTKVLLEINKLQQDSYRDILKKKYDDKFKSFNLRQTYLKLIENNFEKNIVCIDTRYKYLGELNYILYSNDDRFNKLIIKYNQDDIIRHFIDMPFKKFVEDSQNIFLEKVKKIEEQSKILPNSIKKYIQPVINGFYGSFVNTINDSFVIIKQKILNLYIFLAKIKKRNLSEEQILYFLKMTNKEWNDLYSQSEKRQQLIMDGFREQYEKYGKFKQEIKKKLRETWMQIMDWTCIEEIFTSENDCIVLGGYAHTNNYIGIFSGMTVQKSYEMKNNECKKIFPGHKDYNSIPGTIIGIDQHKLLCNCVNLKNTLI